MNHLKQIKNKIVSLNEAVEKRQLWKEQKVVFTNGCFDLIHLGHVDYLSKAADLGNKLIIGVNTDASVSKLKGNHRPIKDELNRSTILAAFSFVDLVVLFDDDTPIHLINQLKPNVLVKGADYKIDDIVGAKEVIKNGGKVELIPFVEGHSTSSLEAKIRNH